MSRVKPVAYLRGSRAVVWDSEAASQIFGLGFYGKPIGIPKPKSPNFEKPLILDLIEAAYLASKGEIRLYDPEDERFLTPRELAELASHTYNLFEEKLLTYTDLRNAGYVVTSGMKFGSAFAVYKKGPGIDHAPFIVDVRRLKDKVDSTDIVRAGRLATTVRKRFIIAIPNLKTQRIDYLLFRWWKA